MPIRKMRDSNLFDILNIHNLRFFQGKSFRQLEKETNIPKSTLHYNIENVREKVAAFERSCEVGGRRSLVNLILTSTFDCQMSTRAISRLIKNIWNTRVSHQTISRILTTCSHLVWFSRREHEGLSKIDRCVTDEIYHKKNMILVLADPDSGFCLLRDSCCNIMSRPWHEFIDQCKEKGFYPKYNTADGGSMMASAFAQCLPKTKHIRDSFHILHYLRKAMKGMEGGCFSLMEQINYYRADCRAKRRLEARSAAGIEIFDKFCITFQHLKYAFNVGDPRQIGRYMNSEDLTQIVRRLQYLLNRFRNEAVRTPRVVDAAKYLENCEDHIRLYKSEMEEQLTKVFSRRERRICQNYFMTLIDFKEHRGRCYESKQRWEYWSKLIAHQEKLIRDFIVKDDARFKYLITACERIYNSVTKSSSMVESVNAVIRRHLRCYKSVPQWFPNLFNEFWNNRKFERGKRKGFAPLELLTGKPPTGLWQDKILRDFPYHTISSSLPINPAYRPILKRDKSRFKELNKEDELYFLFKTKWCAKYLKSYYVSDEEFFADRERHNLAYNTELEKYQNIIAKTFEDRNMAVQTA